MKKVIYIFMAVFVLINCSPQSKSNTCELFVNDSIRAIVLQYVDDHPQYNTFLLRQSDSEICCGTYFPRGILLGPGYKDIIEKKKCRLFFQVGRARVYIESYVNNIIDQEKEETWENTNPEDTVMINNIASVYSWQKYIYKAIFIYYDKDKIKINMRPDSIFVPERTESTIKFVPLD